MATKFFSALVSFLGGNNKRMSAAYRQDLLTWAKTEYANDWQFAYYYMLNNQGKAPLNHTRGIEL